MLARLFRPAPPPPMSALYDAAVRLAREPDWYLRGAVPDTLDGRFDMVALVTSLLLIRLEQAGRKLEATRLTERFIADMDGSLRETGVGDLSMGRHVGRMVSALGGRLGAYREGLGDREALRAALVRNVHRGAEPGVAADWLAEAVESLAGRIARTPIDRLLAGEVAG